MNQFYRSLLTKCIRISYKINQRNFANSIVDFYDKTNDECSIKVLKDDEKIFFDSTSSNAITFPLKRPAYCPFASKNKKIDVNWNENESLIDVACSILIESKDGLLLTKRSSELRTFPGLWVPPGGHIEKHESIRDAARRELTEEIGLTFNDPGNGLPFLDYEIKPLCAWESAFPTFISRKNPRPPKRHHLVLYFIVSFSDESINSGDYTKVPLKLNPKEVVAAAWITRVQVESLVSDFKSVNEFYDRFGLDYREDISELVSGKLKLEQDLSSMAEKIMQYPTSDLDNKLGPVSIFKYSQNHWSEKKFTELFVGLLNGYRTQINKLGHVLPTSRFSIGALYAMGKWLERTN